MKILIADDSEPERLMLGEFARLWGYQPVFAKDGAEAWEILNEKNPPQLALLDWVMPGMDGITLCQKLKESSHLPFTYVILLTGKSTVEDVVTGLNAGADDFITKPTQSGELRSRLGVGVRMLEYDEKLQKKIAAHIRTEKELKAFSYSVSHDLHAPLRRIDGYASILMERHANNLDEKGKDSLARIITASKHMTQLIKDMLELSEVTQSNLNWDAVDLTLLANQIFQELREAQPERKVNITIEKELMAKGDRNLLRIVLVNLLGNAWKFTKKCESAKIEVGKINHKNKPAYFVRDNGAGFDMKYADKLFDPFQRLHSNNEFKGSGIGLATVQRVIHRHGGQIWAEAEPEKGAAFYFTLA